MEARLRDVGLDLWAEFPTAELDPELARSGAKAVLIGNTRALWEKFVAARREDPDPLDAYVMREVRAAFAGVPCEIRWAHVVPAEVAIQQAAVVAGLAWLSPSHLCVHPEYGPWIALRAVVVLDEPAPPSRPRVAAPCDCARGCGPAFERACAAGVPGTTEELRERWKLWLAVRDACPVGQRHRYVNSQIAFHYTGEIPP